MTIRLHEILRYPIKGFPGEKLSSVHVSTESGILYDRTLAIANGQHAVEQNGAWTHCRSFVRLTRNPYIIRYGIALDSEGRLSISHPDNGSVLIALNDPQSIEAANETFEKWFPKGPLGQPRITSAASNTGYWDHRDAEISIINLASLRDLSLRSGKDIHAQRFRGNLHIDGGHAWSELEWLGKRLKIGDAILDVIRPIDRCTAPNINPDTAEIDINIPATLLQLAGHFFCGVYARVVTAGVINCDAKVEIIGKAGVSFSQASAQLTAPPVANWPRPATILDVLQESENVRSFWVRDALADVGIAPVLRPGQHLRLHALGKKGHLWRSYTVSGWRPDGSLRISVKRAPEGEASNWLHDSIKKDDTLIISGPSGSFVRPEDEKRPVTMISAGIGLTPLLAIAMDISETAPNTKLRFVHVCRNMSELALWEDIQALQQVMPNAETALYLDQQKATDVAPKGTRLNSINWQEESLRASDTKPIIYLCGPRGFLDAGRASLRAQGIMDTDVLEEVFASPNLGSVERKAIPLAGPFAITFRKSGVAMTWTKDKGTILDCADRHGLALPAHCRGGACGTCRQTVLNGSVFNIVEPLAVHRSGTQLLCCSVPLTDLVVDA